MAGYARAQGKSPVTFGPTDLVCCRTLQGHTGKVRVSFFVSDSEKLCFVCFLQWNFINFASEKQEIDELYQFDCVAKFKFRAMNCKVAIFRGLKEGGYTKS